jgi:hypothetical protein
MKLPKVKCPYCGYQFDSYDGINTAGYVPPDDGDYSVCIDCGEVGIFVWFSGRLNSRVMNDEEREDASLNGTLNTVRVAWLAMKEYNAR